MINPTLIRKNPPAVLRLFAAGRTGQRAQSPPTGKMYAASVCVCVCFRLTVLFVFLSFLVTKVNPHIGVHDSRNCPFSFVREPAASSVARYTKGSQLK